MPDPHDQNIPGNEHVIKRLQQVLLANRMIGFIGSGASAAIYPTWKTLISTLFDEALQGGLVSTDDIKYWQTTAEKDPHSAVDFVKNRLGDGAYHELLSRIFKPMRGKDGHLFTALHAALVRLPLRGIVTTNYEAGILEARLTAFRDEPSTSFCTWRDSSAVHQWLTGRVFDEDRLPVMFAHGIYNRPETIVLGAESYRIAYEALPYKALFSRFLMEEQLLFVGFGFSDFRLDSRVDELITASTGRSSGAPRHFALIGLSGEQNYSSYMRDFYRAKYNADAIFYRKHEPGDHTELLELLGSLEQDNDSRYSKTSEAHEAATTRAGVIKVLYLALTIHIGALMLGREQQEIVRELRSGRLASQIEITSVSIGRLEDLTRSLLETGPQIVHVAGHGTADGVLLEDAEGNPHALRPDALKQLLSLFPGIECVVLNTSSSSSYAVNLSSVVPFVIGATHDLSDGAAIVFAQGFYQAIGAGLEIEKAFMMGVNVVHLSGEMGGFVLAKRGRMLRRDEPSVSLPETK